MPVDLRDFQKTKAYDAEDVVWSASRDKAITFNNCEQVVDWINAVLENKRVRKVFGRYIDQGPDIDVEYCKRSTWSEAESHRIKIAASDACDIHSFIVVHELAHVFQYRMHPHANVAPHGEEFCRIYLELLRLVCGKDIYQQMIESYEAHGIKY
jgi:hypothetical protein